MFELLALIGALVLGLFVLKIVFGILGFLFQIVLFPVKLVLGIVAALIVLPFLILLCPVFLILGLGLAVVGTVIGSVFCFFCPI